MALISPALRTHGKDDFNINNLRIVSRNLYEKTMTKKKVVLQCPCNFTRTGLEALISDTHLSGALEVVASTDDLEQGRAALNNLPVVDIMILVLSGRRYSLASLLELVGKRLPITHPSCKIVLMSQANDTDQLKRYFSGLENVWITLERSTTLAQWQEYLLNTDSLKRSMPGNSRRFSATLSTRELLILRRLLAGEFPNKIADDLQLSYKTVSHYKRAALAKLGIRSLYPLVIEP